MQRETVLSSTEYVYIRLSYALSTALPIMEKLMEMRRKREVKVVIKAATKCKVYKDNSEDPGRIP